MQTPLAVILGDKGGAVCAIESTEPVTAAVDAMAEAKVGSVLVVGGEGAILGIFTERDLMHRVVRAGRSPAGTRVEDVMTTRVVAVSPTTTLAEALAVITERRLRHLPVVDDGRLIGVVSSGDLTRWLNRNQRYQIEQLTSYITGGYTA